MRRDKCDYLYTFTRSDIYPGGTAEIIIISFYDICLFLYKPEDTVNKSYNKNQNDNHADKHSDSRRAFIILS